MLIDKAFLVEVKDIGFYKNLFCVISYSLVVSEFFFLGKNEYFVFCIDAYNESME